MQASSPAWEAEKKMKQTLEEERKYMEKWNSFYNVMVAVRNNKMVPNESPIFRQINTRTQGRKRDSSDCSGGDPTSRWKRRKRMADFQTSTPLQTYRQKPVSPDVDEERISPIKVFNISSLIKKCVSDPDLRLNLSSNAFFKHEPYRRTRSFSLSDHLRHLNIEDWRESDIFETWDWPEGSKHINMFSLPIFYEEKIKRRHRRGILINNTWNGEQGVVVEDFKAIETAVLNWKKELLQLEVKGSIEVELLSNGMEEEGVFNIKSGRRMLPHDICNSPVLRKRKLEEDLVAQVDQTLPREKIHDPGSPKVTPRRVLTPGRRLSLPQPPSTPRTPVRRRKKSI